MKRQVYTVKFPYKKQKTILIVILLQGVLGKKIYACFQFFFTYPIFLSNPKGCIGVLEKYPTSISSFHHFCKMYQKVPFVIGYWSKWGPISKILQANNTSFVFVLTKRNIMNIILKAAYLPYFFEM